MGTAIVIFGVLALAALAGASGTSPRRRRAVTPQTRTRVTETLGTTDTAARDLPVETPPASVDPDRATTGTGTSSGGTSGGRTQSAWARSREEGTSGGSTATTTTTGTPSSEPASMHVVPPAEAEATEGTGGAETATTHDPDEARRLASATATAVRSRSSGWRDALRAFQRAAGITPDGLYGGLSYNALIYYGIRNPPPARSRPRPSAPEANYVDRVIAPPGGATVAGATRRA